MPKNQIYYVAIIKGEEQEVAPFTCKVHESFDSAYAEYQELKKIPCMYEYLESLNAYLTVKAKACQVTVR